MTLCADIKKCTVSTLPEILASSTSTLTAVEETGPFASLLVSLELSEAAGVQ